MSYKLLPNFDLNKKINKEENKGAEGQSFGRDEEGERIGRDEEMKRGRARREMR